LRQLRQYAAVRTFLNGESWLSLDKVLDLQQGSAVKVVVADTGSITAGDCMNDSH